MAAVEHKDSQAITEEEAQLYDRQIRLWGLDSQKRLRAARILVAGMRGLGCEVAKNLVLSGVNSLTMLDHEALTEEDGESQFLAPRDKVGVNRAEASLERLQALNPGVKIVVDKDHLEAKKPEFFVGNFDVIIVTNYTKEVMVQVNKIARDAGIKFFSGDIFGFFGYCFLDLINHDYVEEVKQAPGSKDEGSSSKADPEVIGDGPTPAKKAKKQEEVADEPETKMVKKTMEFVSLEKALAPDALLAVCQPRRIDASAFFLLMTLFEFQAREGAVAPRSERRQDDINLLERFRQGVVEKCKLPDRMRLVKEGDRYLDMVFSQLSPVAAIVGGFLAQEVIKAVSKKDQPQNNFFLYDPLDSSGNVEAVGY